MWGGTVKEPENFSPLKSLKTLLHKTEESKASLVEPGSKVTDTQSYPLRRRWTATLPLLNEAPERPPSLAPKNTV